MKGRSLRKTRIPFTAKPAGRNQELPAECGRKVGIITHGSLAETEADVKALAMFIIFGGFSRFVFAMFLLETYGVISNFFCFSRARGKREFIGTRPQD